MPRDEHLHQAFDLLFGSSPAPTAVVSETGIQWANEEFLKLNGFGLGVSFLDLVAPHSQAAADAVLRDWFDGDGSQNRARVRCISKLGHEFNCVLHLRDFVHFNRRFVIVTQRDVADTDEGPLALSAANSDARFKAIFNVNTAIKLLIDPANGRIVDANLAAVEFYGWPAAKLRTMRISDINYLTEIQVKEEMRRARSGHRRYFRFRHQTASGELRHVEVHSGPIEIGDHLLLLSIIHDVTARNALQAQLRESQHLEAVGRLAGGVAHEFNNLLTVVMNSAAMAERQLPAESPIKRRLKDIIFASERAAELTRDLLVFGRRQLLEPESLDLNDIVSRMTGVLHRSLGSSHEIVTTLDAKLPSTRSDPRQLEHVLMNLVLNARDAMVDGGRIDVMTRTFEVESDDGGTIPAGRWVCLRVQDSGEGMTAHTREHIFEPFFTTKGDQRGTGLGMATVHGIVTQSGGHIRVVSAVSQGTTIDVLLPICAHSAMPTDSEVPTPSSPGNSAKILLVDDMDNVRQSLAHSLESIGFEVEAACSATIAQAIFEANDDIDVLVTDIGMPGTSGIELAAALLTIRPDLPVLLISGDLHGHDLSVLPPKVGKLQKPVTGKQLSKAINDLLRAPKR